VLEFYAIESPLAMPRNSILGQLLSSVVGVAMCRLFALSPAAASLRWLAAALACATATAVMAFTGTVHPPAGATALLAVVDDDVVAMGWFLIPVVLLGCGLMLSVALLVNNIQRCYPAYWWTPEETGSLWRSQRRHAGKHAFPTTLADGREVTKSVQSSLDDGAEAAAETVDSPRVLITRTSLEVPKDMYLRDEERLLLESLCRRLCS